MKLKNGFTLQPFNGRIAVWTPYGEAMMFKNVRYAMKFIDGYERFSA